MKYAFYLFLGSFLGMALYGFHSYEAIEVRLTAGLLILTAGIWHEFHTIKELIREKQ